MAARQYDEAQARRWLTWLAREMQRRGVTVFQIEDLQPSCLSSRVLFAVYVLVSRALPVLLVGGVLQVAAWTPWGRSWGLSLEEFGAFGVLWWLAPVGMVAIDAQWTAVGPRARALRAIVYALMIGGVTVLLCRPLGLSWDVGLPLAQMAIGAVVGLGRSRTPADDVHVLEHLSWSWGRGLPGLAAGLGLFVWVVVDVWDDRGVKLSFAEVQITGAYVLMLLLALPGLKPALPGLQAAPNQGLKTTARYAWRAGVAAALVVLVPAVVLDESTLGTTAFDPFPRAPSVLMVPALFVATMAFLQVGGRELTRHLTLRGLLWLTGATPLRLARFLNYAASDLRLLQKVGGGYIFVHRLLLEHFALAPKVRATAAGATGAALLALWCATPQSAVRPRPAEAPMARPSTMAAGLRDGDLVFRSGTSHESRALRFLDADSPYSHVGLVHVRDGVVRVVHVEPGRGADGRVKEELLEAFLAPGKAERHVAYRPVSADANAGSRAVAAALRLRDAGIRFDDHFDLDTPDAVYCTELIWRAYRTVGLDLAAGDLRGPAFPLAPRRAVRLSALLRSPQLAAVDLDPRRGPKRR
jgi:Permuted papain-like amidase enzyme, YaeF/YiiX, C92 family